MRGLIYNKRSGVAVIYNGLDIVAGVSIASYTLTGTDQLTDWEFDGLDIDITNTGNISAGTLGTVAPDNGVIYQAIRNSLNLDNTDPTGSTIAVLTL